MLRETHYIYREGEKLICTAALRANATLVGALPPLFPEYLGSRAFREKFSLRFAYVAGAMARGIASEELVVQVAKHGGMAFFGSAGLPLPRVLNAVRYLNEELGEDYSWGMNLIHNLKEPEEEMQQVRLYLQNKVKAIEAAAFTRVTPAVAYFAFKGINKPANGKLDRPRTVFAKISHPYVASAFASPPEEKVLTYLLDRQLLNQEEVDLARSHPVAECITVEADSGGHTDNRPASALFPVVRRLVDKITSTQQYDIPPAIGLAGGIGTPEALSAAYDLGAQYAVVGSVHQSCVEAGTSELVKRLLAKAKLADVTMTASADMFEEGMKVQVLKKGTMMPLFGNQLYEIYKRYDRLENIPPAVKKDMEKKIFKKPISEVLQETKAYFSEHEPSQWARAEDDPKHKMALVLRWYLGKSNQWPIEAVSGRQLDYQIWCGPAMGAFNDWVKGTELESVDNRKVGQVMLNLLEGAAVHKRVKQLEALNIDFDAPTVFSPNHFTLETD